MKPPEENYDTFFVLRGKPGEFGEVFFREIVENEERRAWVCNTVSYVSRRTLVELLNKGLAHDALEDALAGLLTITECHASTSPEQRIEVRRARRALRYAQHLKHAHTLPRTYRSKEK